MSTKYVKDYGELSAHLLYSKRIIYKNAIREPEYENLFDFAFAEKQLYGRVTRLFEPMIRASSSKLKPIPSINSIAQPQRALGFVADAFNKMVQQFQKKAMIGEIDVNDPFLSTLVAYKSTEDPQKLYSEHFQTYKEALQTGFKKKKVPISTFEEMIVTLMPALQKSARKNPFTMTAFVKSTFCPISVSGLAIEIADEAYINDEDKIKLFKNSKNWEFYLNTCRTYGFMVDSNIPWRLIADIGSGQMVEYATPYDLLSTDDILNGQYAPVAPIYFKQFKYGLYGLYNTLKGPKYVTSTCTDGSVKTRRIEGRSYTMDNFTHRFPDQYFLKLYFQIRFMEEESHFTANEQFQLIYDCIEVAKYSQSQAITIFERILNKTFDYNGSLDYIIRRQRSNQVTDDNTVLPNY
tara:strand:+ start:1286 stop:2506 length:1221 start_codon:yes stop_codon:yes gene_type:complete